jgi:hypothetical protein
MRYQLPIYPLLCMMAAWFIFELAGFKVQTFKRLNLRTIFASHWRNGPYSHRHLGIRLPKHLPARRTRMAASRWMFQNVPAAVNLSHRNRNGAYNQPLRRAFEIFPSWQASHTFCHSSPNRTAP